MTSTNTSLGNIYVSHRSVATIAHQSALESYGVVGLAPKNLAVGLANAVVKDPTLGVDVHFDGETIRIDLYIVVEYGTRISTVANSVSTSVKYQVEKNYWPQGEPGQRTRSWPAGEQPRLTDGLS